MVSVSPALFLLVAVVVQGTSSQTLFDMLFGNMNNQAPAANTARMQNNMAYMNPFQRGGLGARRPHPHGRAPPPKRADPFARQAQITTAEEHMSEVLTETANTNPERQKIERVINQNKGKFTGDLEALNYIVQDFWMSTPGPVPPPTQAPVMTYPRAGPAVGQMGQGPAPFTGTGVAPFTGQGPAPFTGQGAAAFLGQGAEPLSGQAPAQYPGQAPSPFPGQKPVGYPGQSSALYKGQASASFPGQAPVTYPGQPPVSASFPGQAPAIYPGQAPAPYQGQAPVALAGQGPVPYPGPPAASPGTINKGPPTQTRKATGRNSKPAQAKTSRQQQIMARIQALRDQMNKLRVKTVNGKNPKLLGMQNQINGLVKLQKKKAAPIAGGPRNVPVITRPPPTPLPIAPISPGYDTFGLSNPVQPMMPQMPQMPRASPGGARRRRPVPATPAPMYISDVQAQKIPQEQAPAGAGTTKAPVLGDVRYMHGQKYVLTDADGFDTFQWIKQAPVKADAAGGNQAQEGNAAAAA